VEPERVVVDCYEFYSGAVSIEVESCEWVSLLLGLKGEDEAEGDNVVTLELHWQLLDHCEFFFAL
jgi:hypothetical protein